MATTQKTKEVVDSYIEKKVKEYAVKQGVDYFDSVLKHLDSLKAEVTSHKKWFIATAKGKSYPSGGKRPKKDMISELSSCADVLRQFNDHSYQAIRSAATIVSAFDIQM